MSNLKISNARNAAQAALAIKLTEMVVLARISCMVGFSNPGNGAHDAAPGPVTVGELPVPHHFRPPKLDSARYWRLKNGGKFWLVAPEFREPAFGQLSIPSGRLQASVSEVVRQRSRVVAIVGDSTIGICPLTMV